MGAYDTTTSVTDNVTDNLAQYHNELRTAILHLMSSVPYSAYGTPASMTGTVTLTDGDFPVLSYSPTAARILNLPTVATTNHPFYVINRSGTYAITIKDAGAAVIYILNPGQTILLLSDGANAWYFIPPTQTVSINTTLTTTNTNAIENTVNNLTITGLTANRNFILPAPSAAGKYITVNILDGHATYFVLLIGDTGVSINGGSTATEFHRIQTKGRSATFVSTSTTNWALVSGIPEVEMTMAPFLGVSPFSVDSYFGVAAVGCPFMITRIDTNYRVDTTNNGTNYWNIDYQTGSFGSICTGINTSAASITTWTRGASITTFTQALFVGTDLHVLGYASKHNAPGVIYATATITVRLC